MKISVIIPAFRVERTLARCIESVRRQDFADWEMILVDDGSDDNSPRICDEYAKRDSRIRVIHKRNAGLGAARNTGIETAEGEYLMFIDSDDYLGKNTLAPLCALMDSHTEWDMAEFPYISHAGTAGAEVATRFRQCHYTNALVYFFSADAYCHSYAWNKIYRRHVFSNTKFTEDKKFEDMFTLPSILRVCETIGQTDKGTYLYTDNPNGITAKAGKELADLLEAHTAMLDSIGWKRPDGITPSDFARYYAHVLNIQMDVYELCGRRHITLKRPRYANTPKLLMAAIIGVTNTCRIFKTIHKICRANH